MIVIEGKNLNQVIIKKIRSDVYELIDCPQRIEDEIWGHVIRLDDDKQKTKHFHSTWLDEVRKVSHKHKFDLVVESQ